VAASIVTDPLTDTGPDTHDTVYDDSVVRLSISSPEVPFMRAPSAVLLVCVIATLSPAQFCGGQGNATLTIPVAFLGGSVTPALSAAPGSPFIWYADFAPGQVFLPGIGNSCLAMSPALWAIADGLGGGAPPMSGSGTFSTTIPLPATPSLLGLTLYSQFGALDIAAPNGVAISNPVSVQLTIPDFALPTAGTMSGFGTSLHRAVPLQDPRLTLIVGGGSGNLTAPTPANFVQLYDHYTRTFNAAAAMSGPRTLHTATLLQDGRVLVTGGLGSTLGNLDTGEGFDPATNSWTPVGNVMQSVRAAHTATLLNDGRVLIAGGNGIFATGPLGGFGPIFSSVHDTVDIYDPVTNTFSPGPTLLEKRAGHSAVKLPGGQVLLAGGISDAFLGTLPVYASAGEIFDPSTNSFSPTGVTPSDRFAGMMEVLPNGSVLYCGGGTGPVLCATSTAEYWDSSNNTWSPLPTGLPNDAALGATARLATGEIVISGGGSGCVAMYSPLTNITVFNPNTFQFIPKTPMPTAAASHTISPLPDGSFLIAGGLDASGFAVPTAHIWNP